MSQSEPWVTYGVPEEGALALDIGANMGEWTGFLIDRFKRVVAYEPNPEAANLLRRYNAEKAGVTVRELAVGEQSGKLELHLYPESQHTSGIGMVGVHELMGLLTVDMVSVDDTGYEPDFMKIDVEGMELAVLRGSERVLEESGPAVVVEVHGHFAEASRDRACERLLESHGYTCEKVVPPNAGDPNLTPPDPDGHYYYLTAKRA